MKISRQSKILELISRKQIETQEELCSLLNAEGYEVTQATVSRDIRALKLTKLTDSEGKQYYAAIKENTNRKEKYLNILREGFVSADTAQNLLVIKTASGMAMAVAAGVDHMEFREVVGSIAGDDTIMMAIRTSEECQQVLKKLRELVDR